MVVVPGNYLGDPSAGFFGLGSLDCNPTLWVCLEDGPLELEEGSGLYVGVPWV
jgi:hypothetical protein